MRIFYLSVGGCITYRVCKKYFFGALVIRFVKICGSHFPGLAGLLLCFCMLFDNNGVFYLVLLVNDMPLL